MGRTAVVDGSMAPKGMRDRLKANALDPAMLTIPLVTCALCLLRWLQLIAPEPYWLFVGVVVAGGAARVVYSALWAQPGPRWHCSAYIGAASVVTLIVAYSTGWGPILTVGFLFCAATAFQLFGARARKPSLVWTAVAVTLGQVAIALHVAPTMIHEPQVQGVATLGLLGSLFVIELIGRAVAGQERLESDLRHSERRFSALVTSSGDIVLVVGADGSFQYASPAFTSVLGHQNPKDFDTLGSQLVHPDDRSGLRAAMAAAGTTGSAINEEIRLLRSNGDWLWFEAAITNLVADPAINGYVASLRDITRRKNAEDRLAHAALYDSLTGLPNRTLILNRAEQMLARGRRERTPVAALFIDLDDFKDINDTLGHEAGDQILAAVATRMANVLRGGDTVGRLGGDEFVVLVEGPSLAAGAEVVAERIRDVLATPFEIQAYAPPLDVTASIGIAEGDRRQPGELLRDADIALYRAKAAGKNCSVVFSASMQKTVESLRHVEVDLHHALERDQFFLVYQPTVDLASGAFNGVEALLRWRHPERGVVQPNDFIPALEGTGLIVPVGQWVLSEACRQGATWNRAGYRMKMCVNISAVQLQQDLIVGHVDDALADSGLDPAMLVLELTETTLMHDVEGTLSLLNQLKAIGVNLAIDDFGTGYSSLAYLRQFPIDVLKIDQSFVSGVAESKESAAIVHTLVQLGKVLGLETVAEGIECDDQRERLRAEDVNVGQGFFFARPLEAAAVELLLRESFPEAPVPKVVRPKALASATRR
jgi:diguanylate cyclase (GGDEF)-like protein/PAS domain S-box-containing protein